MTATDMVEIATVAREDALRRAQPTLSAATRTGLELTELRREHQREQVFARWTGGTEAIEILDERLDALDTWRRWAGGSTLEPSKTAQAARALFVGNDPAGELTRLHNQLISDPATRALLKQAPPEIARGPGVPGVSIG